MAGRHPSHNLGQSDLAVTPHATSSNQRPNKRRDHQCCYCERVFSKLEHLRRHELSHAGWKPYRCDICSKSFGRQDSLVRHARLHSRRRVHSTRGSAASRSQLEGADVAQEDLIQNQATAAILQSPENALNTQYQQTEPTAFDTITLQATVDPFMNQELLGWPESEDLLQLLMSDTAAWPVALPMMQLSPQGILQQDTSLQHKGPTDSRPANMGRGQQAVQNVTTLITDLSKNISRDIEITGFTSDFLDKCFNMFWTRFITSFPILHRPTFVSEECPHPLILNIVAIGSLFIGTAEAASKGEALWRLAHTAVATSWQGMMQYRGPQDDCNGVQLVMTALLGQTYAMLSKNKMIRTTSQIFHGLGFYWAKQCDMLTFSSAREFIIPSPNDSMEGKHKKWTAWLSTEVRKHAILGHYILDGLIAQASGNASTVRHVTNNISLPADEYFFGAKSADDWVSRMQAYIPSEIVFRDVYISLFSNHPPNTNKPLTRFSIWVVLEALQSLVSDNNEALGPSLGTPSISDIHHALSNIYNLHIICAQPAISDVDARDILLRWHSISIQAIVNTKRVALQICDEFSIPQDLYASSKSLGPHIDISAWTQTPAARRALLHAISIFEIIEQLPFNRSHAIHVPFAVFTAATVYAAFLASCPMIGLPPRPVRWSEVLQSEGGGIFNQFLRRGSSAPGSRAVMDDLSLLQVFLVGISPVCLVTRDMSQIVLHWTEIRRQRSE